MLTSQLPVGSWHAQPVLPRLPTRSSTDSFTTPAVSSSRANPCTATAAQQAERKTHEPARPAPNHSRPALNLIDADHFRIMKQAGGASLRW